MTLKTFIVLILQVIGSLLIVFAHSDHKINTPISFVLIIIIAILAYLFLNVFDNGKQKS